jgi:hypothetical protein
MRSSRIPTILLLFCCSSVKAQSDGPPEVPKKPSHPAALTLPGVQSSGAILLPNQWSLRPAGKQLELGDFPVNLALHPGGSWLAVLHAGYGEHEIVIVDLKKQKIASRVPLPECFYGLCFTPDGRRLFASGGQSEVVHAFDFEDGLLFHPQELPIVEPKEKFVAVGLTVTGNDLFVAGPWGDAVCRMPLADPGRRSLFHLPQGSYPYTCLADRSSQRLYVSCGAGPWFKCSI